MSGKYIYIKLIKEWGGFRAGDVIRFGASKGHARIKKGEGVQVAKQRAVNGPEPKDEARDKAYSEAKAKAEAEAKAKADAKAKAKAEAEAKAKAEAEAKAKAEAEAKAEADAKTKAETAMANPVAETADARPNIKGKSQKLGTKK